MAALRGQEAICFYQWGGDLTGSSSPGTLTVAGDHAVTAQFGMRSPVELSVQGEGAITLDPPQPPEGYCPGTEVTVTAVPDADWVFTEWGAGLPNLEWAPSQTFIPTPGAVDVLAYFDCRLGIASLELQADLGAWLVALGVYTVPEEVEAFDYDDGASDRVGRTWTTGICLMISRVLVSRFPAGRTHCKQAMSSLCAMCAYRHLRKPDQDEPIISR